MNGTLRSVMHIGNDYKVLSATSQYPWAQTNGQTPLGRQPMQEIRQRLGIGWWNGSGGLYGTRAQVREAKRLLRRALAGKVHKLQFVNDRLLRMMTRFAGPFGLVTGWDLRQTLKVLVPVYNLLKGVPTGATMASSYWRKKTAPPADMDPDRDGCGLLWSAPVVPNDGQHAMKVASLVTARLLEHGFEPQMSISLATERTLIFVITISYDRQVGGEDGRALNCYRELNEHLLSLGYPSYRWSVVSGQQPQTGSPFDRVLGAVTAALDPHGILAPGRYEPEPLERAVSSLDPVPIDR
jgi:4-cresol dehydrogenase (hydroxylating)